MKILLILTLAVFSFIFYSCSNNSTVTGPGYYNAAELYNYTVTASPVANARFIITQDNSTYYIQDAAGKFFKVTNGTAAEFTVNSSVFKTFYASVYDNNYIVYIGQRVSDNLPQYMVYDNGTYTIYDAPVSPGNFFSPFITERGEFYLASFDSCVCYKFKNGLYTAYRFPGIYNVEVGKSNGNIYFIYLDASDMEHYYKMTATGTEFVRTEPYIGSLRSYPLGTITRLNFTTKVLSLFSESGYTNLFTVPYAGTSYTGRITGTSITNLDVCDLDSSKFIVNHWDGTTLTKQTNVPTEITATGYNDYSVGYYLDKTNYFLSKSTQKVMRMTAK
jgi:hypothetical protein